MAPSIAPLQCRRNSLAAQPPSHFRAPPKVFSLPRPAPIFRAPARPAHWHSHSARAGRRDTACPPAQLKTCRPPPPWQWAQHSAHSGRLHARPHLLPARTPFSSGFAPAPSLFRAHSQPLSFSLSLCQLAISLRLPGAPMPLLAANPPRTRKLLAAARDAASDRPISPRNIPVKKKAL